MAQRPVNTFRTWRMVREFDLFLSFLLLYNHYLFPLSAYISRHYNVIAVDWYRLTQYPCYITALANTRLVAQCTAQVSSRLIYWPILFAINHRIIHSPANLLQMYAYLTHKGSHPRRITCVGHSLGAHICGMMGNHLSEKQHKIIGKFRGENRLENLCHII